MSWVHITDVLNTYYVRNSVGGNDSVSNTVISQLASGNQAVRLSTKGSLGHYLVYFGGEGDATIGMYNVADSKTIWRIFGTETNSLLLSTSDVSPASTQGGTWAKVNDIADGISTWEKIA